MEKYSIVMLSDVGLMLVIILLNLKQLLLCCALTTTKELYKLRTFSFELSPVWNPSLR